MRISSSVVAMPKVTVFATLDLIIIDAKDEPRKWRHCTRSARSTLQNVGCFFRKKTKPNRILILTDFGSFSHSWMR
eukprot:m.30387 g.30387  ORF g.30387 m.30387 type:complete len:76 (+) comp31341_c0_seq4:1021-1248(+)